MQNCKCFADQLWRITEDNKLINQNGHWKYENITLTIPDEGSEGYIQDNRGKIITIIINILKLNADTIFCYLEIG